MAILFYVNILLTVFAAGLTLLLYIGNKGTLFGPGGAWMILAWIVVAIAWVIWLVFR